MMLYLTPFATALLLALATTPVVKWTALRRGWVAHPRPDRWSQRRTALFGGVAIFVSVMATFLYFVPIENDKSLLGILLGGTFMFVVGLIDDIRKTPPYAKLLAQIVGACTAVYSGIYFEVIPKAISVPLTVFWVVGITNAFNLIDNMDGLSAGIAVIASGILFTYSVFNDEVFIAFACLALAGGALGFLFYNFNPARIFMGDSGSMFIGYLISVLAIIGTANHVSNLLATLIVPTMVLGVPIFDTAFVALLRRLRGRAISQGGRDHTSHRLVTLGLSERRAVLLIYAVSIGFGLVTFFYARVDIPLVIIMTVLTAILIAVIARFLSEVKVDPDTQLPVSGNGKGRAVSEGGPGPVLLNTLLLYKRQFLEVLIDFCLICVSYYLAYILRFEGIAPGWYIDLFFESLPVVIAIKLGCFFYFGLYRNVWRYVSVEDLAAIAKAVTLGSLLSILVFTYLSRFEGYSRATFVIDWGLLLLLVAGIRLLFRGLREYFARIRPAGKRVLIVGAGDAGEMLLRELRNNPKLDYLPVGFLDDDPEKVGREIGGVPIIGPHGTLVREVRARRIAEVFVAIPSAGPELFKDVLRLCREAKVPLSGISGFLEPRSLTQSP
ncbi:MAG: glycosyl transferase [Nitrospinota bacterium]